MPSPIFSELSPQKTLFPGKLPLVSQCFKFCSRVFLSIYTPVVWIATLLSLKMVVSLTKSVYIYTPIIWIASLVRGTKSLMQKLKLLFFSSVRRLNKVYFRCNFVALILLLFGSGLHKSLCSLNK